MTLGDLLRILGLQGGGFRGYSVSLSPEENIVKLKEDDRLAEDDIAKIQDEFDTAKQKFSKIPEALKEMPRMHPKGIRVYLLICSIIV